MVTAKVVYSPTLSTPAVFKAHGDDTSTAVLTYPVFDAEGEWIQPDGGDWSQYPLRPNVNWHHGTPVGYGEVTMKAIEVGGKNWPVPVGKTRFFKIDDTLANIDLRIPDPRTGRPTNKSFSREECLSRAAEVKYLVTADLATGVSIEIDPIERRQLNKSLTNPNRFACAYPRWKGLGWAHTFAGDQVNPGAQTVAKAKELQALILDGKRPDGEPFSEVIRKAFETRAATVRVEGVPPKEPTMIKDQPADWSSENLKQGQQYIGTQPVTKAGGSFIPPEAAVAYDLAQVKADVAGRLEETAKCTLCPVTKTFFLAQAGVERTGAEDLIAQAESLEARVGENATVAKALHYDADGFPTAHEVKLECGEGGELVLKATTYVPRLRLADLKPVEEPTPDPTVAEEFDRIYRETLALASRPSRRTRH
jgi:hypothetical protein